MGKQTKSETMATPEPQQVTNGETTEVNEIKSFVVTRDGFRVSDKEYTSTDDPYCINEFEFWKRVETNHSYGAPVEIVAYDPKKHRVW